MVLEKTYIAKAKLGELTDTLDYTGTVIEHSRPLALTCPKKPWRSRSLSKGSLNEESLCSVIDSFGSSYEQTPPLYSALKYQGDPLYKLVREKRLDDQELENIALNKKRVVQLYELKLLSFDMPFFTIKARVSHGTYIRSLVNDIAV